MAAVTLHGVLLFGLLGVMIVVVPSFEEMYRDARMALPSMTQSAIALSNFCKVQFFWLAGIGAGLVYGDWALYGWFRRHSQSRTESRTWSALVLVALVGCVLWLLVALFVPFMSLAR